MGKSHRSTNKNLYIKWFKDTNKDDLAEVGGKTANLGEMTQAGFPVPDGFCVTSHAYLDFLKKNSLTNKIKACLKSLDSEDSTALQSSSDDIRSLFKISSMPKATQKEITLAYQQLSKKRNPLVAVRSSATAEDLPEASFAGQQETFLNVSGTDQLLESVRACWASLFTARAIYYREQKGFDHFQVAVAVPVQLMVQSDISGIMFTVDPITNNEDVVTIEAVFGLGEGIVSGSITPDHYLLNKESLKIVEKKIVPQKKMISLKGETTVSPAWQKKQKLPDQLVKKLAKIGIALEKHYQFPQDIEWAVENKKIAIVQTRPVTTLNIHQSAPEDITTEINEFDDKTLLRGRGASPGIASGKVNKINGPKEISKIKQDEILVATMTTPDYVPAMKRAAAIVTDEGGATCHAAIVSRELGIPCVVGTEIATNTLRSGEVITVDGSSGNIYAGNITEKLKSQKPTLIKEQVNRETATKIYVNLADPERAEEIAALEVDGVGLLRAEFMIAEIGQHPEYLIGQGKSKIFVDKLANGLRQFTKAFNPRPVIYRTTDFKTNEYRNLKGGEKYEPEEANPMLGVRGAFRYIQNPAVFELELEAIKKVRQYYKNLWIMIPFIRTLGELVEVKKILSANNLHRSPSLKLFIMVETPASIISLKKLIGLGIDGVSIGSNDLTQFILAADRDNPLLGDTFNEMDPSVLWAIEETIKICKAHQVFCSICGQAPSVYPELTTKLVEWGITSISVSPDVINETRQLVAKAEVSMVQNRV
ncbi:phosphoenolpyruvate synthase [Patescibacteria group bacterium]|nr:phosphoenolpyruvate synthase [Patescibacteria group bacterium]MBU1867911.1 phosphoenolpyruvate synthase [Patescibacteria group bacterium]